MDLTFGGWYPARNVAQQQHRRHRMSHRQEIRRHLASRQTLTSIGHSTPTHRDRCRTGLRMAILGSDPRVRHRRRLSGQTHLGHRCGAATVVSRLFHVVPARRPKARQWEAEGASGSTQHMTQHMTHPALAGMPLQGRNTASSGGSSHSAQGLLLGPGSPGHCRL